MTKWLPLLILLSLGSFAQETDEEKAAREKILRLYGNKDQVEAVEKNQNKAEQKKQDQAALDPETEQFGSIKDHIIHLKKKPLVTEQELSTMSTEQIAILKKQRSQQRTEEIKLLQDQMKAQQKTLLDGMDDEAVYVQGENGTMVKKSIDEVMGIKKGPQTKDDIKEQIESSFAEQGIDESFITERLGAEMTKKLGEMMRSNPLASMPKDKLAKMLDENMKGSQLEKIIKNKPKLKKILIEFAHDKDALPGLISIIGKPEKVKTYGICVIIVFVVAFIINVLNTKGSIFKRIFVKVCLMFGTGLTNLLVFYFMFTKEVTPSVNIIRNVLGF